MKFARSIVINVLAVLAGRVLDPMVKVSPVGSAGGEQVFTNAETATLCGAAAVSSLMVYPFFGIGRSGRKCWVGNLAAVSGFHVASQMLAALIVFYTAIAPIDPNIHLIATLVAVFVGCIAGVAIDRADYRGERLFPERPSGWLRPVGQIGFAGAVAGLLAASAILYKKNRNFAEFVNVFQSKFIVRSEGYGFASVLDGTRYNQLIDFAYDEATGTYYILERWGRLFSQRGSEKKLLADFREVVGRRPTDELGAYSVLLHKDFLANRKLYLFTTARTSEGSYNALLELDLNHADTGAIWENRREVLKIGTKSGVHNSGSLAYGPDGFLHVGLGENDTSETQPVPNEILNGSILRIDPDKRGDGASHPPKNRLKDDIERDYFIPDDNPFVGDGNIADEVWAYGLRNPFRIAWSEELKGLITGDIGQWTWEELNIVRRGENHGWPFFEADDLYAERPGEPGDRADYAFPLFSYRHDARDRSVVGGVLYQGEKWPDLKGKLIFGDNFSGKIWAMDPEAVPGSNAELELLAVAPNYNQNGMTRIHATEQGELLFCVMGKWDGETGSIYRITDRNDGQSEPADSADGEMSVAEIYATNCALCHGGDGRGDGSVAHGAGITMPDFTSSEWKSQADAAFLYEIIAKGGQALGRNPAMPSWSGQLKDDQISGLVDYIGRFEADTP